MMNGLNQTDQLAHSPESAARRLGIATRTFYDLIAKGEIRSFKSGKRRLIPEAELRAYIDRKMCEVAA